MSAVALTDHGSMAGILDFIKGCEQAQIKPIIGNETYLAFGTVDNPEPMKYNRRNRHSGHFLLLAKNLTGYKNLLKITEYSNRKGLYGKDPCHDIPFFLDHAEGLIATTTCLSSQIAHMYKSYRSEDGDATISDAVKWIETIREAVGKDNFFIEVQKNNVELQRNLNDEWLIPLSKKLDIPLVLTADAHYSNQDEWELRGLISCISYGTKPHAPTYPIQDYNAWLYDYQHAVQSCEEWNIPIEAVNNTKYVADLIETSYFYEAIRGEDSLYQNKENEETSELLYTKAITELITRLKVKDIKDIPKEYIERLNREFKIIDESKYSSYFLTVQDFIKDAKERGIPVGPGRGSGPSSLIVWALGISGFSMDPIKNSLYFERFLNPGRVSYFLDYTRDL